MSLPKSELAPSAWLHRVRVVVAVAILWSLLHFVVDGTVLARGLDRPVVVAMSGMGWLAAPLVAILLWAAALAMPWVTGDRDGLDAFLVTGLATAAWSVTGGTIDQWLTYQIDSVAPAPGRSAAAYWKLAVEYAYLLVVVLGIVALGARRAAVAEAAVSKADRGIWRHFGLRGDAAELRRGLSSLLLASAVAALGVLILTGTIGSASWTRHGQIIFAVLVAFAAGAGIALHFTQAVPIIWYALAPVVVGLFGTIYAGLEPQPPGDYAHLNVIPANAWVRPLPIQMIGVGLVAIVWVCRVRAARQTQSEPE